MARRSDHTREEIRALAIKAGQELLAESGFAKFSTREVARRIGYTVGTLYNIFEGYDDIVLHINAVTLDDLSRAIAARKARKEGAAGIRQIASLYLAFARAHYYRWSALFEHTLPPGTPLPAWYAARIQELFHQVEDMLLPLVGGKQKQAAEAARVLWASIHGIYALGLSGKLDTVGAGSVEAMMTSLIDHYLEGLTRAKP
jgi:AcrR family transcriptional regulator